MFIVGANAHNMQSVMDRYGIIGPDLMTLSFGQVKASWKLLSQNARSAPVII